MCRNGNGIPAGPRAGSCEFFALTVPWRIPDALPRFFIRFGINTATLFWSYSENNSLSNGQWESKTQFPVQIPSTPSKTFHSTPIAQLQLNSKVDPTKKWGHQIIIIIDYWLLLAFRTPLDFTPTVNLIFLQKSPIWRRPRRISCSFFQGPSSKNLSAAPKSLSPYETNTLS